MIVGEEGCKIQHTAHDILLFIWDGDFDFEAWEDGKVIAKRALYALRALNDVAIVIFEAYMDADIKSDVKEWAKLSTATSESIAELLIDLTGFKPMNKLDLKDMNFAKVTGKRNEDAVWFETWVRWILFGKDSLEATGAYEKSDIKEMMDNKDKKEEEEKEKNDDGKTTVIENKDGSKVIITEGEDIIDTDNTIDMGENIDDDDDDLRR